jgi:hypothetical protein
LANLEIWATIGSSGGLGLACLCQRQTGLDLPIQIEHVGNFIFFKEDNKFRVVTQDFSTSFRNSPRRFISQ